MPLFGNRKNHSPNLPEGHDDERSPWFVPAELRDDYAAHAPEFKELKRQILELTRERADAAVRDFQAEHIRNSETGNSYFGPDTDSVRRSVLDAGEQEGDAEIAEHRARLDHAHGKAKARERAAERERRRQAAKCVVCGALDVQTAPVSLTLDHGTASKTIQVDSGLWCAECAVTARRDYLEGIANGELPGGGTRRERVAQRLAR